MSDALWKMGAWEAARAIARGEVSSADVVGSVIARAERVNPLVNAIVHERFALAMGRAREADEATARGESWGPLHGVPFTYKECISEPGSPLTIGSVYRMGKYATRRAPALQGLVDAGAIPIGATNLPEMSFWMETSNLVYGRTNNPYALDRHVGGSSGGEGAILAAGGSMRGVGSDIAGSVRMPAFYCGVFGHKPSQGLVPLDGHYPHDEHSSQGAGEASKHLTMGPMTRSARDLWPALCAMSGRAELADRDLAGSTPKRVLVWDDPRVRLATPVRPDVRLAAWKAAQAIARRRARLRTWSHPDMSRSFDLWIAAMTRGDHGSSLAERFTEGRGFDARAELERRRQGQPRHTLAAVEFMLGDAFLPSAPARSAELVRRAALMRGALMRALGPGGVLVLPTQPAPARPHDHQLLHPFDLGYTGIFNVLNMPVTAVPMGLSREGLPIGVQVVARPGEDDVAIAAAIALEEDFGGWVEPRL